MKTSSFMTFTLIGALAMLAPTAAVAQPVPDTGQVAVGGEFGVHVPADDRLSPGVVYGGLVEFYATPRVGIRGTVSRLQNEFDRQEEFELQQTRLGIDVIYNWEFGSIHPFAGGGVGMYLLSVEREDDDDDGNGDSDTEFGAQLLGGLEFFLNRAWTVKGEGRYQWVSDDAGFDPDGLSLTIGLKRYF